MPIGVVQSFVRILGSPRNAVTADISDPGYLPWFSGYSGSRRLPPPATGCQYPAMVRVPSPGLSTSAFGALAAGSDTSTDRSPASEHVPLRAGRYAVEFEVSVDAFPEQGRQMASPGGGLGLSAPDTTVGPASKPCW